MYHEPNTYRVMPKSLRNESDCHQSFLVINPSHGFQIPLHSVRSPSKVACRSAGWVTFLLTAVMATVVMCRVRNPACTATSALGKERYINGWQEAPLTLCIWRYINEVHLHLPCKHLVDNQLILTISWPSSIAFLFCG